MTCFNQEFADIFRAFGMGGIGTSYDPEPNMRGIGPGMDCVRYNTHFSKGIRLLEMNGFHWDLVYVVTQHSLSRPIDIFFFLTNLNLSGNVNINPVLIHDGKKKGLAVTPGEYAGFLGAIFPRWWKHRRRYPEVQPFRSLAEAIIDGRMAEGCMDFGVCHDAAADRIFLSPEGDISQNDPLLSPVDPLVYGNIMERSLNQIFHKDHPEHFQARLEKLQPDECLECRFRKLCHPEQKEGNQRSTKLVIMKSEWCEARIGFIEKYFEPVTGVTFQ
jgi:radical SAM protein with 4Fe4S-binding SPASM domain